MVDTDPRTETWDNYWKTENPEYACHQILVDHVLKHVTLSKPVILEIGAGSGVDAAEIAKRGHTVVALDMSEEAMKLLKSIAAERQVELISVIGDALNLPFKDNSIDFIYHQGVLEHFKNPYPFLAQHKKVLKTNGKLLADVPQTFTVYTIKKKWAIARKKWFAGWETQYTSRRLRRILNLAGWQVMEIYGRDYEFPLFIWLRDIGTLGKTRFGRPMVPRFISWPIGKAWRYFERTEFSNYFKHCIGAVAQKKEDVI